MTTTSTPHRPMHRTTHALHPGVAPLALLALIALLASTASAQLMHPPVELLDEDGNSVRDTGNPVSPLQTCGGEGSCHDTAYIASHGYHGAAGFRESVPTARPFSLSPGLYGKWDPLVYRRLSPPDDAYADLSHAGWIQLQRRHTGGGPASTRGAESGAVDALERDWEWDASGTVELNCFLCHTGDPDNEARLAELAAGRFRWAATATLARFGRADDPATPDVDESLPLVRRREGEGQPWVFESALFDPDGTIPNAVLDIRDPRDHNCAQCHGQAHDMTDPIVWRPGAENGWATETMGQLISPQRISESLMNIKGRSALGRPWDVHAERMVECVHCHHSLNNPAAFAEFAETRPGHLRTNTRTLNIGEYLWRPSHNFAKGDSAQATVANHLDNSMRRCEDCHNAVETHEDWLPFTERHLASVLCETCHIPHSYAPARRETDWTLIGLDGEGIARYRGVDGEPGDPAALITGYQPVPLPRPSEEGPVKLTPHNIITTWFWTHTTPEGDTLPVRHEDLIAALLDPSGEAYQGDVLAALDSDADGALSDAERRLDTEAKVAVVRARLEAVGVNNPQIVGEMQPYSLHHNVATGEWVVRECTACHSRDSRLATPFVLASYQPYGASPPAWAKGWLVGDTNVTMPGEIVTDAEGRLVYRPDTIAAELYLLGHDRTETADLLGILALIATVLGIAAHGGLRAFVATKRTGKHTNGEGQ